MHKLSAAITRKFEEVLNNNKDLLVSINCFNYNKPS